MIRNYLGFPRGISGMRLAQRARFQATRFGARIYTGVAAEGIVPAARPGDPHVVRTEGGELQARAVLVATGVHLPPPRASSALEELVGLGVYYGAATSAAREMEGRDVFVVGGGNSAGQAAVYLARYAASVTLLVRRPDLAATMSDYLIREIDSTPADHASAPSTQVVDGGGDVVAASGSSSRARTAPSGSTAGGLFLLLGADPCGDWLPEQVVRDERGFVYTGRRCRWSTVVGRPPARAAGDHRAGDLRGRRPAGRLDEAGRLRQRRGRRDGRPRARLPRPLTQPDQPAAAHPTRRDVMHAYVSLEQDEDGYPPFDSEELDVELRHDGACTVVGVPVFTNGIAVDDIVSVVQTEDDDRWWVTSVMLASGHGTVRVVPFGDTTFDAGRGRAGRHRVRRPRHRPRAGGGRRARPRSTRTRSTPCSRPGGAGRWDFDVGVPLCGARWPRQPLEANNGLPGPHRRRLRDPRASTTPRRGRLRFHESCVPEAHEKPLWVNGSRSDTRAMNSTTEPPGGQRLLDAPQDDWA